MPAKKTGIVIPMMIFLMTTMAKHLHPRRSHFSRLSESEYFVILTAKAIQKLNTHKTNIAMMRSFQQAGGAPKAIPAATVARGKIGNRVRIKKSRLILPLFAVLAKNLRD